MAAALRLLSRCRAAAPATLAPLLRPLIPASTALYSKPPYPLHAMGAASLQDLRRAQLCSSPVPSLLRLYSSKGFATPVLQQTTHHQATCRLKKGKNPIQRRSNMVWFLDKLSNDLREQSGLMHEAFETFQKAAHHLLDKGLDDQVSAVFDQGMEDYLKASYVIEKVIDDIVEVTGNCDELPLDTLENIRLLLKELKDSIKACRQQTMKTAGYFETLKKSTKWGWQAPTEPRGIEEV